MGASSDLRSDPSPDRSRSDTHRPGRRRLRRPSGEPPPLPRESDSKRWLWALLGVLVVGVAMGAYIGTGSAFRAFGDAILDWFADHRTAFLTSIARAFAALASFGMIQVLRVVLVIVLLVFKRFRQLVVALVTFFTVDFVVQGLLISERKSPGITALIKDVNYTFPSWRVTALAITLFTMAFTLAPAGAIRKRAMGVAWALVILASLSRVYLGADYPTNVIYGSVFAWVLVECLFRWFVPDEAFPVSYHRGGNAAHLDLGGRRAAAIKAAMSDQLGFDVADIQPFGLAGSGASSPLLMTMEDSSQVFGKIYATSHVRADRWYRIGRTILYGKLEDETPFGSVRRLAEYEDYTLRFLATNGVKVAQTYGLIELTPNREYMIVTEFFDDSMNLGDSQIDETIIDEGLELIHQFWDIGVAHRDIKPANMLVRRGHLQLVDVAGLEIRPSPWREAVDLANMILTMSLQSSPQVVYQRALRSFTPEEISEAFACAEGMAIPTELSGRLKHDPQPIMAELKALAPPHAKVAIQRWSLRRIGLTMAAAIGALFVGYMAVVSLFAGVR